MHPVHRPQPGNVPSTLTDLEVVARVLAGEIELFEVLMRRHNQRVFRAARAIVKDDAEAEDVMQEAYARAFTELSRFEGRAQWSTWVIRIAVNEALGRVRRTGRFVSVDLDDSEADDAGHGGHASHASHDRLEARMDDARRAGNGGSAPFPKGPEDQAIARELGGLLERAVDELPDIYRSVFVLREVEELSTAEAAACLNISQELVKVRLHRARGELRRRLDARVGAALRGVYDFHLSRCDRVVAGVMARIGARPPRP